MRLDRTMLKLTTEDMNAAIAGLVYISLNEEQKLGVANFLSGNNMFVVLPMGYGKNLFPGASDTSRLRVKERPRLYLLYLL